MFREREREEESEGVECENAPRMLYYALHAFSLSLSHSLAPSLHTNRAHINLYGFFHFTFCFVSFRIVFSVFRILYDHALLLRSLSFFSV